MHTKQGISGKKYLGLDGLFAWGENNPGKVILMELF